jgi:predicted RNA-binding Zn-ribbon protein involved in translation (DUF1610 family)
MATRRVVVRAAAGPARLRLGGQGIRQPHPRASDLAQARAPRGFLCARHQGARAQPQMGTSACTEVGLGAVQVVPSAATWRPGHGADHPRQGRSVACQLSRPPTRGPRCGTLWSGGGNRSWCSDDGRNFGWKDAARPGHPSARAERLARLQQKLARQRKCSARWQATKADIGRVHQRVADRRRDWVEKVTTQLAANYVLVAVEALPVRTMVRRPKPKPDPDNLGQFLRNGAAAKAGLNRSIHANCWGLIARRLEQKMCSSGTTLVFVPAQYSSQQCRKCGLISPENRKSQAEFRCQSCGHADHADVNAAAVILARAMPAPTPGSGATPSGVLVKARTQRCQTRHRESPASTRGRRPIGSTP